MDLAETNSEKPTEEEQSEKDAQDAATAEDKELSDATAVEEYLAKNNSDLLKYERQMFLDVIHSDGLLISAKGIMLDRILINLLKAYADSANLILVINFSDWEEKYYKSKLDKKYVHEVSTSVTERERVYLEGGIQFISTRILVVDLLKNRIPIELITGIVVLRAHTIIESCQEAFAIRLYRQKNKTGFIKAFSRGPESFTIGYSEVERTMKNLFLKELFIWPRFHAVIQASLKPYEPQTIELHVPMTHKMTLIQTHLLDIMNYLAKEVKRLNRSVDLQEITVENCVTKKFHKILQSQLDCIWHQLNSQTKLIVSDLKVLRNIMISTIYSDAVNTYSLVKRYRTTEYALSNSGWILLDAAEQLFKVARERVYNADDEFQPESCPKWKFLLEILKVEIPNDAKRTIKHFSEPVKVLILCQDTKTCYQLNQFLTQGGERYLLYMAMKNDIPLSKLAKKFKHIRQLDTTLSASQESGRESQSQKTRRSDIKPSPGGSDQSPQTKEAAGEGPKQEDELSEVLGKDEDGDSDLFKESYVLTMSQKPINAATEEDSSESDDETMEGSVFEPFSQMANLDVDQVVTKATQPLICIQTFKTTHEGAMGLDRVLENIQPQYVIMYHCNVTAIRQLEVFEARQRRPPEKRLKVFFLLHAKTVEEQSYLTSLRREKQAFELLIDTKTKMVIPEYQDGKTDEAFLLMQGKAGAEELVVDTRKAGGQVSKEEVVTPKIIVDMREFRSDLPCLIHKRGIEIVPVTILIGDYILTPEICVERKSISDLIGSLNSGRLYNQCVQMQRFYSKPILLIEFDQKKPFHLQGKYMLSVDSGYSNALIVQKLQLLTLHFPKLRLIWSPSPYATAQIFEELKQGRPEPDPKTATAVGSDESSFTEAEKFNPNIHDFLMRLPGINSKNIAKVMRHGGCLKDLLKKSREELGELLDSQEYGRMLWDILHVAYQPEKSEQSQRSGSSRMKRGRKWKN